MTPLRHPLDVIAASLALPIVLEQLSYLERRRPTGNTPTATESQKRVDEKMQPLQERARELRAIINGE